MSYKEDETIKLPVVKDGVVAIGDLWDCVSSKSAGMNLFGQRLTNEHLIAHPQRDYDYSLDYVKDTKDKMYTMHFDASLSLSFLSGKITIEGSILYDGKDNDNFNKDNLTCNMRMDSFLVQTLPAAKNVIDPDVKALLEGSKKIKATHVCTQVYLGAEAVGKLTVNDKGKLDYFNIEGFLAGSITCGMKASVSVGLKVEDGSETEDIDRTITITSKPPSLKQPTDIGEMFEVINSLPKQIAKEQHFKMITEQDVVGVPIRFVLVPITQFLPDLVVSRTFLRLDPVIENEYQEMMFVLVDYQIAGHFKTLVLHGDKRQYTILMDSQNPFTAEVIVEEKRLQAIAKPLHKSSADLYEKYKEGEASPEDLTDQISKYRDQFKIEEVILKVEEFIGIGKALLAGVHIMDLDSDTSNLKLFTNTSELEDWMSQERKVKVLLNTNSPLGSPGGAFLTLYKLSPFLKKCDIDVAVAYPNISKDFSLVIKAKHLETKYPKEDVAFILELLAVAVEQGKQIHTNFYTVLASLSGIQLPLKDNLSELNPLITALKDTQDVKICTSYLTTREVIASDSSENMWKFVIEANASESIAESLHFYRRFSSQISSNLKEKSEFIVGTFGLIGFQDAPVLFVFRGNTLRAICLNNLDLLILEEKFSSSVLNPDLDLISPEKITWRGLYPSRIEFSLNAMELLGQHHKTLLKDTGNLESLGLTNPPNEDLSKAILITRAALSGKPLDVIAALGVVCLQDFDDLLPVLKKHFWSDVSNCFPSTMRYTDWKDIADDTKDFLRKRNPFLIIVEYTSKRIKYLLAQTGLEGPVEENSNNPEKSKSGEETVKRNRKSEEETPEPPRKTVEEIIDEHIAEVTEHKNRCEELNLKIREYTGDIQTIDIKVNGVSRALDEYLEKRYNEDKLTHLRAFINLAHNLGDFEDQSPEPAIRDILGITVRNAMKNETMEAYRGAVKTVTEHLQRSNLFETLGILSQCRWNPKLYTVHHSLYFLTNLNDIDAITQFVIDMAEPIDVKFFPEDYYDVWQNPKFVYLFEKGLYIDRVIDCLKVYQCEHTDDGIIIPDFLPQQFKERILQQIAEANKTNFPWQSIWSSEESVLSIFQSISVRGYIPFDFNKVLLENITENVELKDFFKTVGILYFWDEKDNLFSQPWVVNTVQKATEKILNFLSRRNIEGIIQVDINIEQESIDYPDLPPIPHLEFIDSWKRVTDDSIYKTNFQKYREMTKTTNRISKEDTLQLHSSMTRIIPYLQEKLKLFNTSVLDPEQVLKYMPYPNADDFSQPGKIDFDAEDSEAEIVPFVSRTDLFNCLLSTSDSQVGTNILSRFSHTRFALPLLIPEIIKGKEWEKNSNHSRLLLPLLKNLQISWKLSPESKPIVNSLFRDPCRLITSFRIGSNIPGKSFMLNSLLKPDRNQDVFFSRIRRNNSQFGIPLSLDGFVEFIWLTEKTCGPDLWQKVQGLHYSKGTNEIILLANIHGDIVNYLDIVQELYKISSCFLVFVMPNIIEGGDAKAQLNRELSVLSEIIDTNDMYFMFMKGSDPENPFNAEEAKKELIDIFGTIFNHHSKPWSIDDLQIGSPVLMPNDVHLPESKKLLNRIRIDSCPKVREVLKLQKLPHYKTKEFNDTWKNNEPLQTLISLFASILTLAPRLRNAALHHLQQEIRTMSFASMEKLRNQIVVLTDELHTAISLEKKDATASVQNQLKDAKENLAKWSLDLEHFFREIGRVYEATDANVHLNYNILTSYTDYILGENEIEIFSEEYGSGDLMWNRWLKDSFTKTRLFNKYRVFVLSILGLTTSGKSTLLNTLFGANFSVHDGGCTLGLHMKLVFLNDQLVEETKYDAILVIDSEGLGCRGSIRDVGVEMVADKETETKMRKLASFVLGISNLTLLNVRGDSLYEMKSILEIAFLKQLMTTNGEKAEDDIILPDVLIIQHEENQGEKVLEEVREAIINACTLADKNELKAGIRTRSGRKLEKILQRIEVNDIRRIFNPFSITEDSNYGPSIDYHHSSVALYDEILSICKSNADIAKPRNFLQWYEEAEEFWVNYICSNIFPLEFRTTKEVEEFMGDQLAVDEVKEAVELAFKSHQEEIAEKMQPLFRFGNRGAEGKSPEEILQLRKTCLKWLYDRLQQITATCKIFEPDNSKRGKRENAIVEVPCRPCQKALKLKEGVYSRKTVTVFEFEKINRYISDIRDNIWHHWTQSLFTREMVANQSDEFEEILNSVTLGECWNPKVPCNITALKRAISLKTTVVSPGRHIEVDTRDAYSNLPHLLREMDHNQLPDLGSFKAFDFDYYNVLKNFDEVDCKQKSQYLDQSQKDWIQEKIKDLPDLVLKIHQAQLYEIGLIRELRDRVDNDVLAAFEDLEKEMLLPDFKWQCHLYAVKIFKEEMEKLQDIWDKQNQPLLVLPSVLENYIPTSEN